MDENNVRRLRREPKVCRLKTRSIELCEPDLSPSGRATIVIARAGDYSLEIMKLEPAGQKPCDNNDFRARAYDVHRVNSLKMESRGVADDFPHRTGRATCLPWRFRIGHSDAISTNHHADLPLVCRLLNTTSAIVGRRLKQHPLGLPEAGFS